ncbi:MAG TPA: ABC transporter permease [Candidatus Hydrogenedentes bacterium]|nr:ABC transporter permease [Candidatus Hydrogenedentota bacterium]
MTATNRRKRSSIVRKITERREFMLIYITLLAIVALAYAAPEFLSKGSISAVLLSLSDQSIIAVGMTILLVSGAFDLSVGSTVALSGMVTAILVAHGVPVYAGIAVGLAVGILIGVINGLIITEVGINPFVTTLGMMSLLRGLVLVISGGQNVSNLPKSFTAIGQGTILGIQYPIIVSLAIVVLGHFLLSRTRFFRQNYYIGGNERAAILSGIDVKRMQVFNFALIGFLAAVAGIVMTARLGSASTTAGKGLELRVISAVIIGGASLKGGEGTVLGAFFGTLLMSIIISSINLLGIDLNWVDFVLGAALLLAVMADVISKRQAQRA